MRIAKRLLKKNDYFMIAAASVALIFITRAFPVGINSWMLLQWEITYETGFILRGLAGSIASLFFDPLYAKHLFLIGLLNLAIYTTALNFFLMWIYKTNKSLELFIFIIFFLSSPFITQWYFTSTMFQRLDVILNISFIASIYIVINAKEKIAATYLALGIMSVFSLMVHSGYAVYSIPCLFGIILLSVYHKSEKWRMWQPLVFYLAPIILFYLALLYFGKPNLALNEYFQLLSAKSAEVSFSLSNVRSIFYMSIGERIAYTIDMMSWNKLINLIGTIILMTPTIAVIISLWVSVIKIPLKSRLQTILVLLLILGTLSTSLAFFLAVDTMRWLGYIFFNNLFALGALMMVDNSYKRTLLGKIEKLKYLIVFSTVLAVILGPTQWMDGFSLVNKIAALLGFN